MANATTPNIGLTIPAHGETGTWEAAIDNDLTLIDAAVGANTAAIATETARATNAEASKATMVALTTETTARTNADALLLSIATAALNYAPLANPTFTGAIQVGANDTGFSRTAAATVAVGNGTAGDASGTVFAAWHKGTFVSLTNGSTTLLRGCGTGMPGLEARVSSNTASAPMAGSQFIFTDGTLYDTILLREAANTLALRNGVNSQTQYIYNTYTDAANYERLKFSTNAGNFEIKAESLGTGTQRIIQLSVNGTAYQFFNSWFMMPSGSQIKWASNDLTLSKISASTLGVGNGLNSTDISGTVKANTVAVNEIIVAALINPVNTGFSTATTGGTLIPATYYYRVAATDAGGVGFTNASFETSIVVPAGTSTNTTTVNWLQVAGATGYKVYGRTAGAELLMATIVSGSTLTFVDTGAITPVGAIQIGNTTGILQVATVKAPSGVQLGLQGGDTWYIGTDGTFRPNQDATRSVGQPLNRINNAYMNGTVIWQNGATPDTGLSRSAAGTVAVGNGTAGDTTGNLQLNKIAKYNGNATAGNGVASIVASVSLTGQTAAIGNTTLFTPIVAGTFRITATIYTQVVGTAGTANVYLAYNTGYGGYAANSGNLDLTITTSPHSCPRQRFR